MEYLNIALAKGRLGDRGYELFKSLGYQCEAMESPSRRLILEERDLKIRFILVKAVDVPTYIERGAADLGIVGRDTIMEEKKDIYEIADLRFGVCRFVVAAPSDVPLYSKFNTLTIATKYPNITKDYFASRGVHVDIIKLNGSVELAPLVGLADAIVDIVETGNTLKDNGLKVIEEMFPISARLVSNKVSFKTKNKRIKEVLNKFQVYLEEEKPNDRNS